MRRKRHAIPGWLPSCSQSPRYSRPAVGKRRLSEEIKDGRQLGLNLIRGGTERRSIFQLAFAFAFVIPRFTRVKCKRKEMKKKNSISCVGACVCVAVVHTCVCLCLHLHLRCSCKPASSLFVIPKRRDHLHFMDLFWALRLRHKKTDDC